MWFEKTKKISDGRTVKKIKFLGITIVKKIVDNKKIRLWLLGIPVFRYKNYHSPFPSVNAGMIELEEALKYAASKNMQLVLWVDHSLGGGTETYSQAQFSAFRETMMILRLQFYPAYQRFLLSFPQYNNFRAYDFIDDDSLGKFLGKMTFAEIVVNNLVGYKNSLAMLKIIANLRHKSKKISFRGHDFQCLCPSFNLLNCDGNFCDLKYKEGCEECMRSKKLGNSQIENEILRSGYENMADWRWQWGEFFEKTVDEVVVFSNVVGEIFCRVYPSLKSKMKVIPHKVRSLPKVEVPHHKEINISMLGEVSLYQKGGAIVRQMCKLLKKYPNVNLKVIGSFHDAPSCLKVTGRYKPEELPNIMKKEKIDAVFIPSIWPETFSYTTAEAMAMGFPVVCYNFGAPAERVSAYKKGLVLQEINPEENLKQIIYFITNLRKEK